jgi:hypothetical protein
LRKSEPDIYQQINDIRRSDQIEIIGITASEGKAVLNGQFTVTSLHEGAVLAFQNMTDHISEASVCILELSFDFIAVR